MYSKSINSVIAVFFAIVFLIPSWMQFEHSFHKHEDTHFCYAKGSTKHIHQESNENCSFLHYVKDYNFTFEIPNFQLIKRIEDYVHNSLVASNFSLLPNLFKQLRAPPIHFIS